jgi:hypothetical protein
MNHTFLDFLWNLLVIILLKQSWTADKGLSSSLGLGEGQHSNELPGCIK